MVPLVSILIPAYNSESWIGATIQSALSQTWPTKEVIVVDDGSTDATLAIAKRFESARVRVLSQSNQGASVARNTAYSVCQGEYIQWLDADDLLAADKVEQQMHRLGECSPRTLLSGAWGSFRYRPSKARFVPTALWRDLNPTEWLFRKMDGNLHMQTDNWLVSRELSTAAGPWDGRLWRDNDGEYFCRVLLASDGVRFVSDARSYYRSQGFTSISYIGGSDRKLESLLLSMKLHIAYLLSLEDSERTRLACARYIRTWLHEFRAFRPDLMQEFRLMTLELGHDFEEPRLPWKYQWIVNVFGWKAGKRTQVVMRNLKRSALAACDRAMWQLESRTSRPNHP